MPLPFGLKVPSRNTLIFSGIAGGISGIIYTSNKHAEESRKRLAQRVAFLADRPCGVHEMPRKVTVYISAPPGDGLEKSRNWFREYVKPILVAGAVDYEVKEAKTPGQIESSVIEEVVKRRRETQTPKEQSTQDDSTVSNPSGQFNASIPEHLTINKDKVEVVSDGILAIGRNAYREVLSGLSKGCDASLAIVEEVPVVEAETNKEQKEDQENAATDNMTEPESTPTEIIMESVQEEEQKEDHFSLPNTFSPVIYVPHINIIGWSNIPYRLYMWYADYKRIDAVGKHVVAAVLNQTRPMEPKDADKGQEEKKYWNGDESVEELKANDTPIEIDERIIDKLETYTSDDLP